MKNHVFESRSFIRGDQQSAGINYSEHEVSVPVADLLLIRVLTALAAEYKYIIHHLDISSVYLNGHLSEDNIYVRPPHGYKREDKI